MSGPKTASYGLSRARRRELAEQQRLRTEQRRRKLEAQRRRQTLQAAIAATRSRLERLSETLGEAAARFPDEAVTVPQRSLTAPDSTDDNDRFQSYLDALSALANEQEQALGRELQRVNANARRRDCAEATDLFAALPEPQSADEQALADHLNRVALGSEPLDPAVRVAVADWKQRAAARATQEQAAQVVRESLQDLGYEVEEGFATLFVERGMVHFTRPEWNGYYVRLRANAAGQYLNFNLVRAATGQETLEQGRRDQEAEERWCQGYRPLLQRLEERGLSTQSIRELAAGSMAVQTLEPGQLGLGTAAPGRQTPAVGRRSRPRT